MEEKSKIPSSNDLKSTFSSPVANSSNKSSGGGGSGIPDINKIFEQQDLSFIKQAFMIAYTLKKPVSTAPTYIPKNFFEQFVFYENGSTRRLYVRVGSDWRYATLT